MTNLEWVFCRSHHVVNSGSATSGFSTNDSTVLQPERVAHVLHFQHPRAFVRRMVRLVQNHHQLSVETMKQHRIPTVLAEQRLCLLLPRAGELARFRHRHTHGVAAGAETRPDHHELRSEEHTSEL